MAPFVSSLVTVLLTGISLWSRSTVGYVWPDEKIDELESILYEQGGGIRSVGFAVLVHRCGGTTTTGRSISAEWLRTAYHDMATADVVAGTGGIDASIAFEMDRDENKGDAFRETLAAITDTVSARSSMADMVALAAIFSVGVCSNGTVVVPFRGGRIDATGPGPSGVPEPQQDLETHTSKFEKQGFNVTEMIGLVACGHSLGGVHGIDFPEITPIHNSKGTTDDSTVTFDSSTNVFDNKVATEFVFNTTQNPLISGQNETTRSDKRIFGSDGGDLIRRMAESPEFYAQTCTSLFERMLNTVPKEVTLTDVITPIPVKPRRFNIEVNANETMTIAGSVRIADDLVPSTGQVLIRFACSETSCPVATAATSADLVVGCFYPNCAPDGLTTNFHYYDFSIVVPIASGVGISSFTVEVVDSSTGESTVHDNTGHGFPVSTTLLPQVARSCRLSSPPTEPNGLWNLLMNLTVALHEADRFDEVNLVVYNRITPDALVPNFTPSEIPMKMLDQVSGTNYTLFQAEYLSPDVQARHLWYDVVASGPGVTAESKAKPWIEFLC